MKLADLAKKLSPLARKVDALTKRVSALEAKPQTVLVGNDSVADVEEMLECLRRHDAKVYNKLRLIRAEKMIEMQAEFDRLRREIVGMLNVARGIQPLLISDAQAEKIVEKQTELLSGYLQSNAATVAPNLAEIYQRLAKIERRYREYPPFPDAYELMAQSLEDRNQPGPEVFNEIEYWCQNCGEVSDAKPDPGHCECGKPSWAFMSQGRITQVPELPE